MAAQEGLFDVVSCLLDANANVNVNAQHSSGATPLLFLSQYGNAEIIQQILSKGADPHAMLDNGMTPLAMAQQNGHVEVTKLLEAAMA